MKGCDEQRCQYEGIYVKIKSIVQCLRKMFEVKNCFTAVSNRYSFVDTHVFPIKPKEGSRRVRRAIQSWVGCGAGSVAEILGGVGQSVDARHLT